MFRKEIRELSYSPALYIQLSLESSLVLSRVDTVSGHFTDGFIVLLTEKIQSVILLWW